MKLTPAVARTGSITLAGVPLSIRSGEEHVWTLTAGVRPFQRVFELTTARANEILAASLSQEGPQADGKTRTRDAPVGPLVLRITSPGREDVEIAGLYVLANQPGGQPGTRAFLLSDSRWRITRGMVERAYNIPRRSGDKRIVSGSMVPIEIATRADDRDFRPGSLDGTKKWTAQRVLEDMLLELFGVGGFVFDDPPTFADSIQGFTPPRPGEAALNAAFAFLPGMTCYHHPDGKIHVFNSLLPRERALLELLGPIWWGSGGWEVVDRSRVRPSLVEAFTEREIELRGDYVEGSADTPTTVERGREPVAFENVAPCVDATLELADGRIATFGELHTIDEYLEGWLLEGDFPSTPGPLTQGLIRRYYPAGMSYLHQVYTFGLGGAPSSKWARRIGMIQEHWRRTFRLLPAWVDKLRRILPLRAAVLDVETGTRAPAQAFMDYIVKPSFRALATQTVAGDPLGWGESGWAADLANAKVSPATVEVVDEQTGLFRVTLQPDVFGNGVAMAPGALDADFPTASAGDAIALWSLVGLDDSFRLAVVFTAIPDAPNNEGRLQQRNVTPEQAAARLPGLTIGPCNGPVWRVFAGDETARFAWKDDNAAAILDAVYTGAPPPEELWINQATVDDVCVAQAARVYAALIDRAEGSFSVSLDKRPVPCGSIQQVRHAVKLEGRKLTCRTDVIMPPVLEAPSLSSLLPESTRRVLRKLVDA